MNIEQQMPNVQELQRLNEAITVTMDAVRRVIPHLVQLQQTLPFVTSAVSPYAQLGHQGQVGIGQGVGMNPLQTLATLGVLAPVLAQLAGVGGLGQQGIGQQGIGQQGIGQQGLGQNAMGLGAQPFASPFGFGVQSQIAPWLQALGGVSGYPFAQR